MDAGHRAIDHTADRAIEVWAPDLGSLITQAARGLIATVLDEHDLQPTLRQEIAASADEPEVLIHDMLTEMLYLIEDDELMPVAVELLRCDGAEAALTVDLVPLADALPYVSGLIKAVTYHGLEIQQTESGLRTMIVFDT
ncbi:MAG TPA: hypothetical protein DGT21_03170, partial [Armatimonadetes bacterium]|jgi:SHS2 domain-containing protein|nr:hypothetical protein [Armatimonadota bacterium]